MRLPLAPALALVLVLGASAHPDDAPALRLRARSLLRAGEVAAALEAARASVETESASADGEALVRWCEKRLAAKLAPRHEAATARTSVRSCLAGDDALGAAVRALARAERAFDEVVPVPPGDRRRTPVWLLDPETFAALAPEGARAFYQRDEMAVFVLAEKVREVERLAVHEAFHAHFHRAVEDPPAWLDEGLADLFAGEPNPIRARDLRLFLESGRDVRFRDLATRSRRAMYEPDGIHLRFAAAWGWVHFLRAEEPARLERYVRSVLAGASAEEAFAAGFGDVDDLVALESRWRAHALAVRLKE